VLAVETDEGEREDLDGDDESEVPDPEADVLGREKGRGSWNGNLNSEEINPVEGDERDRDVAAERRQPEGRMRPPRRDPPADPGGSFDRRGGRRGAVQRAVRGQAGLR
jgi:hypothetical protein